MAHITDKYSEQLIDFLTLCKDYCALIEHAQEYSRRAFVRGAYKYLPEIFRYVSQMSNELPEDLDMLQDSYAQMISDETVSYYEEQLRVLLGEDLDLFLNYPVGEEQEAELQPERLSHLLVLIYREVGTPLIMLKEDAGELFVATLALLRNTFEDYWGDALLSTLRVLHYCKHESESDGEMDEPF